MRHRLLQSEQRHALVELVERAPGLTINELRAGLGMGWGTLYHHLRALESTGRVHSVALGRRRLVYPTPVASDRRVMAEALLRGRTARAIAQYVAGAPNAGVAQIAKALGLRPRVVYYHAKRLTDLGVLTATHAGRRRTLSASRAILHATRPDSASA